jgi:hypothetical protein
MHVCALLQIVLDEAFPDLTEGGNQADVRTAIEQSGQLLAVSDDTHLEPCRGASRRKRGGAPFVGGEQERAEGTYTPVMKGDGDSWDQGEQERGAACAGSSPPYRRLRAAAAACIAMRCCLVDQLKIWGGGVESWQLVDSLARDASSYNKCQI